MDHRHMLLAATATAAPHLLVIVHVHAARMIAGRVAGGLRNLAAAVLGRRPAVSVVTPTWRRARLLKDRCMPSVRAQTYGGAVEHIVVSDGPDEELAGSGAVFLPFHVPALNRGLAARRHGATLASGDVIAYLDDDNAWRPEHLALLVGALTDTGSQFAYSQAAFHGGGMTWLVGASPPAFGRIDTSLIVHRRDLLDLGNWQPSRGPADWDLVSRWLAAGAKWAFVPKVTLDYYIRPYVS